MGDGESADDFARRCAGIAALGIGHVIVITAGPWSDEKPATPAAAVPALRELG